MKTCSKVSCSELAEHYFDKGEYCDKHYVWYRSKSTAKKDGKYVPTLSEFNILWEKLVSDNFCCPCPNCKKRMIIKSSKGSPRGNVVTLQHWNNGGIELICHSCNTGHGQSKLGDAWKDVPKGYKFCPQCETIKTIDNFSKCSCRFDGLRGECRLCNKNRSKDYRKNHKEKNRESQRKYHYKNRDKINEKRKERRKQAKLKKDNPDQS